MSSIPNQEPNTTIETKPIEEAKRSIFPSFVDLAAIFGVFILAQLASFFIVKISLPYCVQAISESLEQAWILLLTQVISMPLTILFIIFLRRKHHAAKIPMKFSILGFNPTVLLGGILMILSTSIVIEPIAMLLPPSPAIVARGLPLLIAVVIGAPIFEEIICRGLIYGSMRNKYGVVIAWLGSSLFFGLMHLEPMGIVNGFFMGLILCYIYIRSRSLIAPMILHAFNNAIAYLFIILGLTGDSSTFMLHDMISNSTIYYILYAVALIILIISTFICTRQFKQIIANNKLKEVKPEAQEQQTSN